MDRKDFLQKLGLASSGIALGSVLHRSEQIYASVSDNRGGIRAVDVICTDGSNVQTSLNNLAQSTVDNQTVIGQQTQTFDKTKSYAVGTSVIHGNKVYVCKKTTTAGQDWDVTEWSESTLTSLNSSVTGVKSIIKDTVGVLGVKNLLQNKATTQTVNGVTFTVNADGSVDVVSPVSGTGIAWLMIHTYAPGEIKKGHYKITGCPSGGSGTTYMILFREDPPVTGHYNKIDIGSGVDVEISDTTKTYMVFIGVVSGLDKTLHFDPMLRLASDPDDTYQPYAMTNRELTEEATSLNSSLTASDNLKFRFATDGEGNYGYLDADDSFVPFSKDLFYNNIVVSYSDTNGYTGGTVYNNKVVTGSIPRWGKSGSYNYGPTSIDSQSDLTFAMNSANQIRFNKSGYYISKIDIATGDNKVDYTANTSLSGTFDVYFIFPRN